MKNYKIDLQNVFKKIPTHGFGSLIDLKSAYIKYLEIACEIRRDRAVDDIHLYIHRSREIRRLIDKAFSERKLSEIKVLFDKASNYLAIETERLMERLENCQEVEAIYKRP